MNLIATAEALKNLSDAQLRQSYSSGTIPQFLGLAELQRRNAMRTEYAQRDPQNAADTTIADKLLMGVGELPTSEQIAANMTLAQQPPAPPPSGMPTNNGGSAGTPMPSGPGGYTAQAPASPGGTAQGFAMGGVKKFAAGGRVGMAGGGETRWWLRDYVPPSAIPPEPSGISWLQRPAAGGADPNYRPQAGFVIPADGAQERSIPGSPVYFDTPYTERAAPKPVRAYRGDALPTSGSEPQAAIYSPPADGAFQYRERPDTIPPAADFARPAPVYRGTPLPDSIAQAQRASMPMADSRGVGGMMTSDLSGEFEPETSSSFIRRLLRGDYRVGPMATPQAATSALPDSIAPASTAGIAALPAAAAILTPEQLATRGAVEGDLPSSPAVPSPAVAVPTGRPRGAGAEVRGTGAVASGTRSPASGGGVGGGGGGGVGGLPGGGGALTDRYAALRDSMSDRLAQSDEALTQEKVALDQMKGDNSSSALIRMGSTMMEAGARSGNFLGIFGSGANAGLSEMEKREAEQVRARQALLQTSVGLNTARQQGDLGILGLAQHDKSSELQRATQLEVARMHAATSGASSANSLKIAQMQIDAGRFDKAGPIAQRLAAAQGRSEPNLDDWREAYSFTNPSYGVGAMRQETQMDLGYSTAMQRSIDAVEKLATTDPSLKTPQQREDAVRRRMALEGWDTVHRRRIGSSGAPIDVTR